MWVGSGRLERVYPRRQRTNNHEQDGVFLFAMVPRMRDLGTVRPPSASECLSSAMSFAANIYSIATYACIYRERNDPSARPQIAFLGGPGGALGSSRRSPGALGLQRHPGSKKCYTSQLKCKSSIKMSILLGVFEGRSHQVL